MTSIACILIEGVHAFKLRYDVKLLYQSVSKIVSISELQLDDEDRGALYIRSAVTAYKLLSVIAVKSLLALFFPFLICLFFPEVLVLGLTFSGVLLTVVFSLFYWKLRLPHA